MQLIPINEKKIPLVKEWQTSTVKHELNSYGVGLVCGHDNIEAIDIDLKYDLTGELFKKYKLAINQLDKNLLNKLVVQKTMSNGYHFIYKCAIIEGNKKLANRYANEDEKKLGEKVKVLIETRGIGGYIAIVPTPKYELIHGSFDAINEITENERDILMTCAREFNEVFTEVVPIKHKQVEQKSGLSPFEDYNERGNVIELLESNGWKVVGNKENKTLFKRPGQTSANHSGNFDHSKNWFSVFTTSSEFETEKAYLPYAVFAKLECKDDFTEASRKLYNLGFGDRFEKKETLPIKSKISIEDDNYDFVATGKDYNEYLNQWREGTFKLGAKTGIPQLDVHYRFKENSLVVANGVDNVGKSTVLWFLMMLGSLLHGYKWIVFSSENSVGSFVKKMIEYYWSLPISEMTPIKYKKAKDFVESHYTIILSSDSLYTYEDVLNMTKKIMLKDTYFGLLIDPYNSLAEDLKVNAHSYHYKAISDIKLFTKQNKISIYVNMHAVTSATRTLAGQKFLQAPKKGDTEGGGKAANKADDFLTIHREVNNPERWMETEIHVRKIKETETGGKVTGVDNPVILKAIKGLVGFVDDNGINPILAFHNKNGTNYETFETPKLLPPNTDFLDIVINDEKNPF